jgi:RNA polymerase sigma-70 factor (ECF subfamily)
MMSERATAEFTAADNGCEQADEQLLLKYRDSGQRELFETLVQRYERELFSYLRRFLGHTQMAEDAFQGTFLQVHLKCGQFVEGRRFRPWLYAIATNQAIDVQRRNKRHRLASLDATSADGLGSVSTWSQGLVSDGSEPQHAASLRERGEWLRGAMGQLTDSLRSVVQLVYFQGLKYREAAEALDIPVGTVKSRLHAAIARLSQQWQDEVGNEESHSEG